MIDIRDKTECTGCTACKHSCGKNAIFMRADKEGFLYPQVDASLCVKCKKCVEVCASNIELSKIELPSTFAVKTKELDVLLNSSSGGVFFHLTENILEEQGVVFGAAFTDDLIVKHIGVESLDDVWKLMGSKYVQSDLGDVFKQIKELLELSRKVLFVGTPCQVAGLKTYLKKDYGNLILVDFICHGVPSPLAFEKYVETLKRKYGNKINLIKFRDKSIDWKQFSVAIMENKNCVERRLFKENIWMQGFLDNLFLRPSCYECKFKAGKNASDITIGDFWGIQTLIPEFYDGKGVSMCCLNTEKGKSIFALIKENFDVQSVDYQKSISLNTAYSKSAIRHNARDLFFENIHRIPIESNIEKSLSPDIITRVKLKMRTVSKKYWSKKDGI